MQSLGSIREGGFEFLIGHLWMSSRWTKMGRFFSYNPSSFLQANESYRGGNLLREIRVFQRAPAVSSISAGKSAAWDMPVIWRLAIFACMKHANDVDRVRINVVAEFVSSHQQASDFVRLKAFEQTADARIRQQGSRRRCEHLHRARCGVRVGRLEKFMQALEVGQRLRGPTDFHYLDFGTGNGWAVPKDCAHR